MKEPVYTRPVKALIVDDTPLMRKAIRKILDKDGEIEVIGMAANGRDCLEQIPALRPDVITLDIDMPVMNGITALKNIMVRHQLPIVMISSLVGDGYFAFEALRLGVVDFLPKPSNFGAQSCETDEEMIRARVRLASQMRVHHVRRVRYRRKMRASAYQASADPLPKAVVIGTNLAGPNTIMHILGQMTPDFPGAIIAIQEIHPRILAPFCSRFDQVSPLPVIPVTDSSLIRPGAIFMASSSSGVRVVSRPTRDGEELVVETSQSDDPPIDQLFSTAARHFGPNVCGVLLTGVGTDGAEGLQEIRNKGGLTLGQKLDCCVYPNLVENAVRKGAVDAVLSPRELAERLQAWV
jgi:two-component system chemotaxis response regulator CheB